MHMVHHMSNSRNSVRPDTAVLDHLLSKIESLLDNELAIKSWNIGVLKTDVRNKMPCEKN